jgi:hypothetical protein
MEPGQRPLDVPTGLPQTAAVGRPAPGNLRLDPALPQFLAALLRVVSPVTLRPIGALARPATRTLDRRDRIDQRQHLCRIVSLRPGQFDRQRDPLGIGNHVVLAPLLAAVRRVWAGQIAPLRGLGRGAVDQGARPVDQAVVAQFVQEDLMQPIPDSGPLPCGECLPAGTPASPSQLGWQVVPGDPSLEDEDDAGEDLASIFGLPARESESARLLGGKEWLDAGPQFIADQWLGHG